MYGIVWAEKWYEHWPSSVAVNEQGKHMWDTTFLTDKSDDSDIKRVQE